MKYLITVAPKPDDPNDFIPQYFTTAFVTAEDESEAEKIVNGKGFELVSIYEVESSISKVMLYLDKRIDDAKEALKGVKEWDNRSDYFRHEISILTDVLRVAQGLVHIGGENNE